MLMMAPVHLNVPWNAEIITVEAINKHSKTTPPLHHDSVLHMAFFPQSIAVTCGVFEVVERL